MSVFGRRRKLVCFFCGHSQSIVTADPVRKFTCTSPYCQSVNHLDEQGNIVDYVPSPQSAPAQPVRYARSVRSPSPAVEASGSAVGSASPIFCRSCEKNLAIKRNILADYLPPEDDPEYEIYCAKLPDFKRSLEEKYPEPCATCALKAEQKIKEANYQAKAAMIGRLLERSQNMKPAYRQEPWGLSRALKLGFWLLRGTGWIGTHLLVIAWHGTTLLYPIPITEQKDITGTWATCVEKTWQERRVSMACYESSAWSIQKFIPWSWLFLFWNYQALAQTRHPKAKLTGLWEFIKCEFILFFIRWAAWFVLSPGRVKTDISIEAFQAMNFGFLALSIIGFVYAMTTLRIVEPARINLRESVSPLANSPDQSPPREKQKSALTPLPRERQYPHHSWLPPSTASTVKSNFPPFKAEPLMPAASTFSRASSLPPLSPQPLRSDAAGDEMDWNPTTPAKKALGWGQLSVNNTNQLNSQSIFRSNSSNQPQQQNVNSPFSAPIPPAPRTSLYQQFVTKPPIKKEPAAEPQRENFFRPSTSDGRSTGPTTLNGSAKQYPPLAEARFFPKKVDDEDTGLEGLISGALKLEDEPEVIRNARVTKATSGTDLQLDVLVRLVLTLLAFCAFTFIGVFTPAGKSLQIPEALPSEQQSFKASMIPKVVKLLSLLAAGTCPVWKLVQREFAANPAWDMEQPLLAGEGMASVLLIIFAAGETNVTLADVVGQLYLGWILTREAWAALVMCRRKAIKPPAEPQRPEDEKFEKRRRELSPGFGEWPRPPKTQQDRQSSREQSSRPESSASVPAQATGIRSTPATLRREGSSNLSTLMVPSSGFQSLKREGSGGLASMVGNANTGFPSLNREGSGVSALRREGSTGLQSLTRETSERGFPAMRREGSLQREGSGRLAELSLS